jgi:hypothetical protein
MFLNRKKIFEILFFCVCQKGKQLYSAPVLKSFITNVEHHKKKTDILLNEYNLKDFVNG